MAGKSGPPRGGRRQRPRPAPEGGPTGGAQRLQKVLAAAGVASRRDCEELIREGRVEVDGQAVTEMGVKVDPALCEIRVDGTVLRKPKLVYYAINKPPGVVCTSRDPAGRPRVIDLAPQDERVFAVGRLDRASEGLILTTNDGEFANRVTHPRYGVDKTYIVRVAGRPTSESLLRLRKGVWTSDGLCRVQSVQVKGSHGQSTDLIVVLAEGKNREIRRILARVGHKVLLLRRVAVGPVRLGKLESGAFRRLTPIEVAALMEEARQKRKREKQRGESRPKRSGAAPAGAGSQSPQRGARPGAPEKAPAEEVEYREELRSGGPARGSAPRGDVIDFEAGDDLPPARTRPREIANLPLLDEEDELEGDFLGGDDVGGGFASGEIPAELLDDDFDFHEPLAGGEDEEEDEDESGWDEDEDGRGAGPEAGVFRAGGPAGGRRPQRGGSGGGRAKSSGKSGFAGSRGAKPGGARSGGRKSGGAQSGGAKPGGKGFGKKFRGGKSSAGDEQRLDAAGGERAGGGRGQARGGVKFGKKPGGKRPFGKPGGGRGAGDVQQGGGGRPAGGKPGGKPAGGKFQSGKFGGGKQRRGKRPGGGKGGGGRQGGGGRPGGRRG